MTCGAVSQITKRLGSEFSEASSVVLVPGVIPLHPQQMQKLRLQHAKDEPLQKWKPVAYDYSCAFGETFPTESSSLKSRMTFIFIS